MLFNSLDYIVFLAAVFLIYWTLRTFRKNVFIFLLAASCFFYMSWNPKYILLVLFSSSLDYFCGWMIYWNKEKLLVKRLFMALSVIGSFSVLFFFKYFNFVMDSFQWFNLNLGLHIPISHIQLILPVGISFYTFQTLSYTIDIYRGKLEPVKNYIKFAMFVGFFPQLEAGPIVRASQFLPQLENTVMQYDSEKTQRGLFLIIAGLFKKVIIADFLARMIVDPVFDMPLRFSGIENLAAVYAYALQIYNDFSGYSDIAIGSALLLGYELPLNFNSPYKATSLQDFWRRWHISLSSWLRDYLYISLGGNRKGPVRTYVNLMLTMLLGGLWHGANWKFVIWGGLHGVGLAISRFIEEILKIKIEPKGLLKLPMKILSIFLTFHLVCVSWVFFRARDMHTAFDMIGNILKLEKPAFNMLPPAVIGMITLGFILHFMPTSVYSKTKEAFVHLSAFWQAIIMAALACLIYAFASGKAQPFIYFRF